MNAREAALRELATLRATGSIIGRTERGRAALDALLAPDPEPDGLAMPDNKCSGCLSSATFRLPPDWQDRVHRGQPIPIVGCGDPWHYVDGAALATPPPAPEPASGEDWERCQFRASTGVRCPFTFAQHDSYFISHRYQPTPEPRP